MTSDSYPVRFFLAEIVYTTNFLRFGEGGLFSRGYDIKIPTTLVGF